MPVWEIVWVRMSFTCKLGGAAAEPSGLGSNHLGPGSAPGRLIVSRTYAWTLTRKAFNFQLLEAT